MNAPKTTGLLFMGVGTILTSMMLAGFLLGYVLDAWLATKPIFMVLLCGLGFVGGILKVYKLLTHPASH
jgi:ATP synthase protein I